MIEKNATEGLDGYFKYLGKLNLRNQDSAESIMFWSKPMSPFYLRLYFAALRPKQQSSSFSRDCVRLQLDHNVFRVCIHNALRNLTP